jgi:hypothetical protein
MTRVGSQRKIYIYIYIYLNKYFSVSCLLLFYATYGSRMLLVRIPKWTAPQNGMKELSCTPDIRRCAKNVTEFLFFGSYFSKILFCFLGL